MAKTYNRMNIEIGKPINSIGIHPVEGDTNSRYLDVSLYNNGVPINLTGERVRINFLKENGLSFFNQGEITDAAAGRCQFALTNDVLSEAEELKAQISIWGIGGEILSTETFNIYVSENIRCDEAVEGTNEFGVLVVLFQEIQNALDLMQRISDGFGEPGEKAAEYGVSTFWGILETLAGRADVDTVLQNYIKTALNSTMGTGSLSPLNELLLNTILPRMDHGVQTFTSNGTFTVPKGIKKILVTACGGGGGGSSRGGQGGDYIFKKAFSVMPSSKISIIIGTGGNGSRKDNYGFINATDGGATVIGNLITISGGLSGEKHVRTHKGAMGGFSGDTIESQGNDTLFAIGGRAGKNYDSKKSGGGGGGASLGNGGAGGGYYGYGSGAPGENGERGGGGGGGANDIGGNGGSGIAIIEW